MSLGVAERLFRGRGDIFFIALIFALWFAVYAANQAVIQPRHGWDSISHIATAIGIAEDFDISSRHYSIMGLIRQGYPSHFQYYPVFDLYLAPFVKIFGSDNLRGIYLASWLAGLGTLVLIYKSVLLFVPERRWLAFATAAGYLAVPGVMRNFDTALMEPTGAFLLALFTYLFLCQYQKGAFTYKTAVLISAGMFALWLFKQLFIGFLIATVTFVSVASRPALTGKKLEWKLPIPFFLALVAGIFIAGMIFVTHHAFYALSPSFVFDPAQKIAQTYADPFGGLFHNFPVNIMGNIRYFFTDTLSQHLVYRAQPTPYFISFLMYVRYYFFFFFAAIVLAAGAWKKYDSLSRAFLIFAGTAIAAFYAILHTTVRVEADVMHRYSIYYLPLYILFIVVAFLPYRDALKARWKIAAVTGALFLLFFYIPLSLTMFWHQARLNALYEARGERNTTFMEPYLAERRPQFIYFKKGSYAAIRHYPIRQIEQDATNEQLVAINMILPEPIDVLFVTTGDLLYENNKDQIAKRLPILEGKYEYLGFHTLQPLWGENEALDVFVYGLKTSKVVKK